MKVIDRAISTYSKFYVLLYSCTAVCRNFYTDLRCDANNNVIVVSTKVYSTCRNLCVHQARLRQKATNLRYNVNVATICMHAICISSRFPKKHYDHEDEVDDVSQFAIRLSLRAFHRATRAAYVASIMIGTPATSPFMGNGSADSRTEHSSCSLHASPRRRRCNFPSPRCTEDTKAGVTVGIRRLDPRARVGATSGVEREGFGLRSYDSRGLRRCEKA